MYTYAYPRPALTVDALVMAGESGKRKLLLIRRKRDPFAGLWALPGGFAEMEETLERACIRELAEETGLKAASMEQFRVYDAIHRDPRHRTVSVVFYVFLNDISPVSGGDDAAEAGWFPPDALPGLAFDHSQIVNDFLQSTPYRNNR